MGKTRDIADLPNAPVFMVGRNSAQGFSPNVYVKVAFNVEVFDPTDAFNMATSRFQPDAAGFYQLNTNINVNYTGQDNAQVIVSIYKNGTEYAWDNAVAGLGNRMTSSLSTVMQMNGTTDYAEIFVYSTAAAGNSVDGSVSRCSFSGAMVRPA